MEGEMSRTVVIADDDTDIRGLVAIAVKRAGLELLHAAEDGEQAWAALQEHHPDLVVLDVSMPGLSGLELCRKLRADESFTHTTIVLLTAGVDQMSREAGTIAGADYFLSKPFSPKDLGERLAEIAGVTR
jgi:DNA-binding response OmpR family regulator